MEQNLPYTQASTEIKKERQEQLMKINGEFSRRQ